MYRRIVLHGLKYRIIINNNIMHYQYIDRKAKAADLAI